MPDVNWYTMDHGTAHDGVSMGTMETTSCSLSADVTSRQEGPMLLGVDADAHSQLQQEDVPPRSAKACDSNGTRDR